MASISDLTTPMLKKILEYYLETEGYVRLIRNIYNVCTSWRNICKIPSLWVTYDGSLSFENMMMVCEGGCFKNTLNFTISSCDSRVSNDQVSKLFFELKNVNAIDLSNLKNITPYIIEEMGSKCSNLHKILFGKIYRWRNRSVSNALDTPLKVFFSRVGLKLLSIDLSCCKVPNLSTVIIWITDDCPNLEELHLVQVESSSNLFPTNIVQKKCPKLKVLKLDGRIKPSTEREEDGFPNLEVFAFEDKLKNKVMNNVMLKNILFNSSLLKSLDITNCDISPNTLYSLPTNHLQILNMTGCVYTLNHYEPAFIQKWRHSLKAVDFSLTNFAGQNTNTAIIDLISTPSSPLEKLYLSSTVVNMDVVAQILDKCSGLRMLDLNGCEHLPVEMQSMYEGNSGFELLKSSF